MKTPVAFKMDAKLLARLRAFTTQSKDPYHPTQNQVMENALKRELDMLEKKAAKNGK